MTQRLASPSRQARIAGGLYVVIILLGLFAEVGVREGLVRPGNPLATADAILSHEFQFRLGFAAELVINLIAIPVTVIMYRLLQPVDRGLALTAIVFDLTQNTVNAINAWTQFAPLTLLSPNPELSAVPLAERAAFARLALHWHDVGFQIALGFFGVALLIYGVLIARSTFWPRWLGLVYGLAGASYLVDSFAFFLAPDLDLGAVLLPVCLAGESVFALWLLARGIDEPKWRAAAKAG